MPLVATAIADARRARLMTGLDRLGVNLSEPQQAQSLAFLEGLAKWNAVYNLTSVRDIDDMLPVHLLDSLSIVPLVDRWGGTTILDVGSGAGLPGIPLAIGRPALRIATVDAVAKKISFQQHMKGALGLANLTPIHSRVEALTLAQTPSLIVTRAYSALRETVESIAALVDSATIVLAMKGGEPIDELSALPADWELLAIERLDVPYLGAERCAVVLRRRQGAG